MTLQKMSAHLKLTWHVLSKHDKTQRATFKIKQQPPVIHLQRARFGCNKDQKCGHSRYASFLIKMTLRKNLTTFETFKTRAINTEKPKELTLLETRTFT